MLREDDEVRLHHMLDAAREALEYLPRRTRTDLDIDRTLVHSLVRCIEIIGEAATNISDGFRDSHPEFPWSGMIGMRNRLIHGYFDLNLNIVWKTATEELPVLVQQLDCLLRST